MHAKDSTGKNRSSGDDAIRVEVKGPTAEDVVATVVDFSNGRYEIAYVPPVAGDYTVAVMLDENAFDADDSYNHIRGSPFEVECAESWTEVAGISGAAPSAK